MLSALANHPQTWDLQIKGIDVDMTHGDLNAQASHVMLAAAGAWIGADLIAVGVFRRLVLTKTGPIMFITGYFVHTEPGCRG